MTEGSPKMALYAQPSTGRGWAAVLCWCLIGVVLFRPPSIYAELDAQALIDQAQTLRLTEPAKAAELVDQAEALALAVGNREALLAAAGIIHRLAHTAGDYASGLARIEALRDQSGVAWTHLERAQLTLMVSESQRRLGDREVAMTQLEGLSEVLEPAMGTHQKLVGQWLSERGVIHHQRGEYDRAVDMYLQAQRLLQAADDALETRVLGLINLGITYERIRDLEAALQAYETASQLFDEEAYPELAQRLNANVGITYQALGRLDEATSAYRRGAELAEALNRPLAQAQALLNIGTLYYRDGDYTEALTHYQQSLAISEAHDIGYGILLNLMNIGVAYSEMGEFDLAIPALEQALERVEGAELPLELSQVLRSLAAAHRGAGNLEEAHRIRDRFDEVNEEIFDAARDRAVTELRVAFESELTEKALLAQTADLSRARAVNQLLMVVMGFALLAIIGLLVFYRTRLQSMRLIYERNRDLMESQFGPMPRREAALDPAEDVSDDGESKADTDDMGPRYQQVYEQLLNVMKTRELYRNPDLTVMDLAVAVGSNRRYVSAAISRYGQGNFSAFVNFFRVNEARRRLAVHDGPLETARLIEECGFSSRSVFYSAFRKGVGLTPKQFYELAVEERQNEKKLKTA